MSEHQGLISTRPLSRRGFLKQGSFAVGGTLVGAPLLMDVVAGCGSTPTPAGTQNVILHLGWLAGGQQAGEYLAIDKGYFRHEGINLTVIPGGPSLDSISLVASGSALIGQTSSSPALIQARARNVPIVAFACALQKHPFAFFSLKKSNINAPTDFIGKKVGIQATARPLISAVLAKYNIPQDQVHIVTIAGSTEPLMTGQVDVATGWVIDQAQLATLPTDGYNTMLLWDLGIQLYANPYFTTQDVLAKQPHLLAGFTRAAARGWVDAFADPSAAIASVARHVPNINQANELATIKAMPPFMFDDTTQAHGWGWMDLSIWQANINTYFQLSQIDHSFPASEIASLAALNLAPDRPKQ